MSSDEDWGGDDVFFTAAEQARLVPNSLSLAISATCQILNDSDWDEDDDSSITLTPNELQRYNSSTSNLNDRSHSTSPRNENFQLSATKACDAVTPQSKDERHAASNFNDGSFPKSAPTTSRRFYINGFVSDNRARPSPQHRSPSTLVNSNPPPTVTATISAGDTIYRSTFYRATGQPGYSDRVRLGRPVPQQMANPNHERKLCDQDDW